MEERYDVTALSFKSKSSSLNIVNFTLQGSIQLTVLTPDSSTILALRQEVLMKKSNKFC
jgi:hypothetical protein